MLKVQLGEGALTLIFILTPKHFAHFTPDTLSTQNAGFSLRSNAAFLRFVSGVKRRLSLPIRMFTQRTIKMKGFASKLAHKSTVLCELCLSRRCFAFKFLNICLAVPNKCEGRKKEQKSHHSFAFCDRLRAPFQLKM